MITLLTKLFIKNATDYTNSTVRYQYGNLCSIFGILLNLLLFTAKLIAGILSQSIAITADALNNLSDSGSAIITLIGFRFSSQKADSDHPYGHGRAEYVSGFIVSLFILFMGYELITSSINKIITPSVVQYTPLVFAILVISVLIKLYMYAYNHSIGNKIDSSALKATGTDSLSDSISTSVVLISSVIGATTGLRLEGYCGVLVGLFVLYSGINTLRETLSPIIGNAPTPELVAEIHSIVRENNEVIGIHDLIVHDYGPGNKMISLHAEVSANGDFLTLHDTIDNIEKTLQEKLDCQAVIHMDPISFDDEETNLLKQQVTHFLSSISSELHLHDFRIVKGPTHTNIIFDLEVPFTFSTSDEELTSQLITYVKSLNNNYYLVLTIDKF